LTLFTQTGIKHWNQLEFNDAEEVAMETTQMLMASGGLLTIAISLLVMLLPLILLVIAWRILKWTSSTAHQVTRLTEQMDALLLHLKGGPLSDSENDFMLETAADDTDEHEDTFDFFAAVLASEAAENAEDLAAADPFAAETGKAGDEFEFPAEEDAAFGAGDMDADLSEPAAEFTAAEPGESDDVFGASADFEFDLDDLAAGSESLDELGTADAGDDDFSAKTSGSLDPLDDSFDAAEAFDATGAFETDEPDGDANAEATAGDDELAGTAGTEDRQLSAGFDHDFPAGAEEPPEEETTEAPPAIIRLDDDPARPDVNLARCGQCDHKLAYKKNLSGKKARCPSCKGAFVLP
jgi:hypothetical protein